LLASVLIWRIVLSVKKWLLLLAGSTLVLVVLVIGGTALEIYAYSLQSEHVKTDAIIVLGAATWGNRPSPVFQERINYAVELYRAGWAHKIIMTGGAPTPNDTSPSTVARNYAAQQGIPVADLLTETQSTNTIQNLRYAQAVGAQQGFSTYLIVSDPMHMKRAMTMAYDLGMTAYTAPTPTTRFRSIAAQSGFLFSETFELLGYLFARQFGLIKFAFL
jgi:uncharacterized SAM-binding protein YcdF (DUF218 family)